MKCSLNTVPVLLLLGCHNMAASAIDEVEGGSSSDDINSESSVDFDAGVDQDPRTRSVWYDSTTGLYWQDSPNGAKFLQHDAINYCSNLSHGDYNDWRLPKIQELISLIRGCDTCECGVSDPDCLEPKCSEEPECQSCSPLEGPGNDGCYWYFDLNGSCEESYRSISHSINEWFVDFSIAKPILDLWPLPLNVRCVRNDL
ncbi:MAG: DUF1566 domain-containing protein [Proteobacteria bacterium]|nr:DUF1566 domain-containing protein [Pseudomonadota bacterium]